MTQENLSYKCVEWAGTIMKRYKAEKLCLEHGFKKKGEVNVTI